MLPQLQVNDAEPETAQAPENRRYRFGPFVLDTATGELERDGETVQLPPQAAQVLGLLVTRAGELVTRDELRRELWPGDVHVEADLGINHLVRKVRQALGDDAASPTYVETLPRRGYRFRAPVEPTDDPPSWSSGTIDRAALPRRRPWLRWALAAAVLLVVATTSAWWISRSVAFTPVASETAALDVFPLAAEGRLSSGIPPAAEGPYLQGLALLETIPINDETEEGSRIEHVQRAIRLLEEAVEGAPDFADGWASLARAYEWNQHLLSAEYWGDATKRSARRALAIDDTHPVALAMLAVVALHVDGDWTAADRHSELAIRYGPDIALTHRIRAEVLMAAARIEAARAAISRARQLDPTSWRLAYLEVIGSYLARDWPRFEAQLSLLRKAYPHDLVLTSLLVRAYLLQARPNEALEAVIDYRRATSSRPPEAASLRGYWEEQLSFITEQSEVRSMEVYWRALPLIGLGRHREAAELLARVACVDRDSSLTFLHVDPFFRLLAGQPAYREALRCAAMPGAPD